MIGFVYLLGNPAMPCYFKIGCTERSPHARARELSSPSGVPHPFHVLAYIEVEEFQKVERHFHSEMSDFRGRFDREFFVFGPAHMAWLWYVFETYPGALSFASPMWRRYAPEPEFPDGYVETWTDEGEELLMPDTAPIDGPQIQVHVG